MLMNNRTIMHLYVSTAFSELAIMLFQFLDQFSNGVTVYRITE